MYKTVTKILYNKDISIKFDNLSKDDPLKQSLTKIILNEGKFIGHISAFISKFIKFQVDALDESLSQNISIINAINDGTTY